MMKRVMSLGLSLALAISLAACSSLFRFRHGRIHSCT